MRHLRLNCLSSAGARVITFIVLATLPLAAVSAVLAWHAYRTSVNGGFDRSQADLFFARSLIVDQVYRVRLGLEALSSRIVTNGTVQLPDVHMQMPSGTMCRLMLLDETEKIIYRFPTPDESSPDCAPGQRAFSSHSWLKTPGGEDPAVSPFVGVADQKVYVKVTLRTPYPRPNKSFGRGFLVGIKYFPIAEALNYSDAIRGVIAPSFGDLWLYSSPTSTPLPLVTGGHAQTAWTSYALARIARDARKKLELDHFQDARISYSYVPVFEGRSLVATRHQQPKEAHALDLFLARVAFITLMLIIELALVAIAAHFYLVSPLQRLAQSVNVWRRTGHFNPSFPRSIPSEVAFMLRAFRRATRELDRHEAELKRAMREQDVLIKEIHHRVKNNLQIVASLLNLQAKRISQPEARREFQEIRERVLALATLHRHLYPDGGAAILQLENFLGELARQLYAVYAPNLLGRVELDLKLDSVTVTADQAVPVALIVTEVMTNAFAHAFSGERSGAVKLSLSRDQEVCTLTIQDDGIGFDPQNVEKEGGREKLGLKLIAGFTKQLGGEMTLSTTDGTQFVLTFIVKPVRRMTLS